MNLSIIMDYLCGRTSEETSIGAEEVKEDAKNDDSDRRNQFGMQIEKSTAMPFTRSSNTGTPPYHNLLRPTATRETRNNIFSEKVFSPGCFSSNFKSKKTPISVDRDQRATVYDVQNSTEGANMKTIEKWLHRFEKPAILPKLEKSLEGVKRNKISKESHVKLLNSLDKELQMLSKTFHPDRAGDHESQSALNAIREVLKTLTEVFLENIFIDYKYEYFSRLDASVLVNENERNNTIQAMFYKISVLSETKRMNIIGEIRKFLTESEKCVKCYTEGHKRDFEKFRDYSLYHLRKNIEGYEKLEKECNILIEECSKEDNSIRTVVQKVVDQSLRECLILRKLEHVARSSFQGNFEIYPIDKTMDKYYILPFVDYINVLSMCNLLLKIKSSYLPSRYSRESNFAKGEERFFFIKAYFLAYDIYDYKKWNMEVREKISINEHSLDQKELGKTLVEIFKVLQKSYKVDVYKEGKSNRAEMYEKLLALKNILKDIEEKEKKFGERVNQYKTEWNLSPEPVVNYRQDKEESFKVDMAKGEKEREDNANKISSLSGGEESQYKMRRKQTSESVINSIQDQEESFKVGLTKREKEGEEDSSKFSSPLEGEESQYKMEWKESSESVLNYAQDKGESFKVDMTKRKKGRGEDANKISPLSGGEESQYKMGRKQTSESVKNTRQDQEETFKVDLTKREKESEVDSSKFSWPLEGEENQYKMEWKESSESVLNYTQDKGENFEVGLTEQKKRREDANKISSLSGGEESQYKMRMKPTSVSVINSRQDQEESLKVGLTNREKESEEDSSKFNSLSEDEKTVEELHECKEELSKNPSTEEKWVIIESSEVIKEVVIDCGKPGKVVN